MDRLGLLALPQPSRRCVALLPLPRGLRLGCAGGLAGLARSPGLTGGSRCAISAIAFGREKTPARAARARAAAFRHRSAAICSPACGSRELPREEIAGHRGRSRGWRSREPIVREKQRLRAGRSRTSGIGSSSRSSCPLLFKCRCGTIYQRLGNPLIDAEVRASRARLGLQLFERKEGFQGALAVLRAGGVVGVLIDQHAGDGGVWCPFFGRLASTSSLAAMLALRTGAALIPGAVYTEGRGRWRLVYRPPVVPGRARERGRAHRAAQSRARARRSAAQPADWFWVHNRWKTPRPKFLLATYKRGVVAGGPAPLQPFRVLIRSANWLGDAVMIAPRRARDQARPARSAPHHPHAGQARGLLAHRRPRSMR